MYADAQKSWALARADSAKTSPEAGTGRWPLPISFLIVVGASSALWFGIIKLLLLIG